MKTPPTLPTVLALLEEATLAEEGTIDPEAPLLGMEGWDSMGMVMFIALVQDHHGFELSITDLRDCVCGNELLVVIAERAREPS
ncbi:MAG: phosphopantetheine-binding protein [Planctomycetota bacterium]|nr:phosphopantetheine-binding protein [Planctomycetota bacterium]